jgi:hypothetical protein
MVTFLRLSDSFCPSFWTRIQQRNLRRLVQATLIFSAFILFTGCTANVSNSGNTTNSTGTLTASSQSVAFGSVPVGQTASTSFSVVNEGSTAVSISQMSVSGQSFSATGQGGFPVSISPGSTYNFTIQFNPAAAGLASGQLTITSNATNGSSLVVSLSGMGTTSNSPLGNLSSLTCANGTVMGSATDACMVTLSSAAGSGGLTVALSSNNSAVTVPVTVLIPEGATSAAFTANITAVPTAQTVILMANADSLAESFSLQLQAAASILTVSTSSINFGNVDVSTSETQTLTLSSTGTSSVTVTAASITGTGFVASGATFPLTLNPGDTANVNVQFVPAVAGSVSGQLTLASTSSDNLPRQVALSANGCGEQRPGCKPVEQQRGGFRAGVGSHCFRFDQCHLRCDGCLDQHPAVRHVDGELR